MKLGHPFPFRIFLIILFCILFITAFSRFGAYAYETVFLAKENFSEGTMLGPVNIENLSYDQAFSKVNGEVGNWKKNSNVVLTLSDRNVAIPLDMVYLLIEESLGAAVNDQENKLYSTIQQSDLEKQVLLIADESLAKAIDIKRLKAEIENSISALPAGKLEFKLADYIAEGAGVKQDVIASSKLNIIDTKHLEQWLKTHGELNIPAKMNVSFLQLVTTEQGAKYPAVFLSEIASVLYSSILPTNVQILERHTSQELPNGIEAGYEAKVIPGEMDLLLFNPNDFDIKVRFSSKEPGTVTAEVLGLNVGFTYKIRMENKKEYQPKQIIQYVPDINMIQNRVKQEGKKGYSVSVYRDILDSQGKKIESIILAEDFYLPVNEIVVEEIVQPSTQAPDLFPTGQTDTSAVQENQTESLDNENADGTIDGPESLDPGIINHRN
ncbi:hypothetical protein D0469_00190 [Peribacillus saganii]|uniref:Uncharacterized protein n=1 Tax=Peribacillus saganii TaxID=2303992 RepID=A0A372LUH6_9BACI|nr:G5 domain-containing protein [Peribacillus saganii]RFU71567.1 hypothetical protein D0469_00190 [Peribacillus saganii]